MVTLHKRAKGAATGMIMMVTIATVASLFLLVKFFMSFNHISADDSTEIATQGRIMPYGSLKVGSGIPVGERTGDYIFEKVCFQCHAADSTVKDSPKVTHNADWAPRIAKGLDTLKEHAINGFNAMPARGGRSDLTDEEVERAIVYMTNQSGGHFPEPPAPGAEASSEAPAEGEAPAADAAPAEGAAQ